MKIMISTVIPIVIPYGSGDGFRQLITDLKLFIDQISSYVGFDFMIVIKVLACILGGHLIYKMLCIITGTHDLFE